MSAIRNLAAGIPVCGIVGPNGAGKTLLGAESVLFDLRAGREVYSTVQIDSPYGSTKPIVSLRQLTKLRDCTVFLDEVAVIFSARATSTLPKEVEVTLQTLRHTGVTVIWTAPDWKRADILLRGVTQGVIGVHPLLRKVDKGNPWPRPRLILAGVLDTTQGKVDEYPTKILRRLIVRPSKLQAWGTFDSRADTPMIGGRVTGGRCVDCGGGMETPKHSKARHDALGLPFYDGDLVSDMIGAGYSGPRFDGDTLRETA